MYSISFSYSILEAYNHLFRTAAQLRERHSPEWRFASCESRGLEFYPLHL
jgi:hypothetical protein